MIFNVALKFWLIRPWHWYRWYPCGFFAYFLFYFFCSFFWLFLALAVRQSAALIGPSKTMAKLPMTLHCGGARKDVGGGFFSLFGGSAGSDDSFIVGYYYHFIAAWMGGNIVIATSCIFFLWCFFLFFFFSTLRPAPVRLRPVGRLSDSAIQTPVCSNMGKKRSRKCNALRPNDEMTPILNRIIPTAAIGFDKRTTRKMILC